MQIIRTYLAIHSLKLVYLLVFGCTFSLLFIRSSFALKPVYKKPKTVQARKVISTSVCTDAYIRSFIQNKDIVALSWQYDHSLSPVPTAEQIKKPKAWLSAERLYMLSYQGSFSKPTHFPAQPSPFSPVDSLPLIILDATTPPALQRQLKRLKLPFFRLEPAETYQDILENIRLLGQVLNRTEQSEVKITELSIRLATLEKKLLDVFPFQKQEKRPIKKKQIHLMTAEKKSPSTLEKPLNKKPHFMQSPSFLYLNSGGMTTGRNSFVSHALEKSGGRNSITSFRGFYSPSLEDFVELSPDIIVTSYFKESYISLSGRRRHHKVLKTLLKKASIVNIPGHIWNCASPLLIEASEIFYQEVYTLPPQTRLSLAPKKK